MHEDLVSIIIPAFNREMFIGLAVESVLAQDHPHIEIIVVDDGSTDKTADIAESFGPRVTCIRQANKGPSAARNAGIRLASGPYISFLDSDDVLERDSISHRLRCLKANPDAGMVISNALCERVVGRVNNQLLCVAIGISDPKGISLERGLYRRAAWDRVGSLDEELRQCEDWDWLARARDLAIPAVLDEKIVVRVRKHDSNITLDTEAAKTFRLLVLKRALDRKRGAPRASSPSQDQALQDQHGVSREVPIDKRIPGLLSVVIPTYNAAPYLAETLNSVISQNYNPLEIVIVDDGSEDDTVAIAEKFLPRQSIILCPHRGPGPTRNTGIGASKGEFVALLDSDDLMTPGAIDVRMKEFAEHPETEIVMGKIANFLSPELPPEAAAAYDLQADPKQGHLPGAAILRASAFARYGVLDVSIPLLCDFEWIARARDGGAKIRMIGDIVVRRRIHGKNLSLVRRDEMDADRFLIVRASLARRRKAAGVRRRERP